MEIFILEVNKMATYTRCTACGNDLMSEDEIRDGICSGCAANEAEAEELEEAESEPDDDTIL